MLREIKFAVGEAGCGKFSFARQGKGEEAGHLKIPKVLVSKASSSFSSSQSGY